MGSIRVLVKAKSESHSFAFELEGLMEEALVTNASDYASSLSSVVSKISEMFPRETFHAYTKTTQSYEDSTRSWNVEQNNWVFFSKYSQGYCSDHSTPQWFESFEEASPVTVLTLTKGEKINFISVGGFAKSEVKKIAIIAMGQIAPEFVQFSKSRKIDSSHRLVAV